MKKYKVNYSDGESRDTMEVVVDGVKLYAEVKHSDFPWVFGDVPVGWYDNLSAFMELEDRIEEQAKANGINPECLVFSAV